MDISYVHAMRLVEYDTEPNVNAHPRRFFGNRESRKGGESTGARSGDSGCLPEASSYDLHGLT